MFGLTIPFAIEATRRNPVRASVRNLVAFQGDDIVVAVTVYGTDGTPINISNAMVSVTLQREAWGLSSGCAHDYGAGYLTLANAASWSSAGVIQDGTTGQAVVTISRVLTNNWWGRFRLYIAVDDINLGCVAAEGVLDVRHCPGRVRPLPPIVPPIIQISDFSGDDFLAVDFLASPENVLPNLGARLADDFGARLKDDFGLFLSL